MAKVVRFTDENCLKRTMVSEILKEVKASNIARKNGTGQGGLTVKDVADRFLAYLKGQIKDSSSTPVVRLAKELGFSVYSCRLADGESGEIKVKANGDKWPEFGSSQVILVNECEELRHQRFVIAHELAHFLFDYLGIVEELEYIDTYTRDNHDSESEQRANLFAAELMMPREEFKERYKYAKSIDTNYFFVLFYLSKYFQMPTASVERRIKEVIG